MNEFIYLKYLGKLAYLGSGWQTRFFVFYLHSLNFNHIWVKSYGGNDFDFDVTQSQASLASYWLHFILVL